MSSSSHHQQDVRQMIERVRQQDSLRQQKQFEDSMARQRRQWADQNKRQTQQVTQESARVKQPSVMVSILTGIWMAFWRLVGLAIAVGILAVILWFVLGVVHQ